MLANNPVDVVKTRLQNQHGRGGVGGVERHSGAWQCLLRIARNEGLLVTTMGGVLLDAMRDVLDTTTWACA